MTVKEVVIAAATSLGIGKFVREYIEGSSVYGMKNTELLLDCYNMVENELALDYLPLYAEEEVETQTGVVPYSIFSRKAVRILRVSDEWENSAKFTLFPEYLKTQQGKVKVAYTYTPEKKTIDDNSDYLVQASVRLLAYGVAAEYCLASGMYEDAAVWDKKYKDAINAAYKAAPCRRLQSRWWA
ncbi:MAG: hypothetical protein IKD47_06230 [Clostridia bacterium]|nr:hypothetical protein [Clostridia bacterium]